MRMQRSPMFRPRSSTTTECARSRFTPTKRSRPGLNSPTTTATQRAVRAPPPLSDYVLCSWWPCSSSSSSSSRAAGTDSRNSVHLQATSPSGFKSRRFPPRRRFPCSMMSRPYERRPPDGAWAAKLAWVQQELKTLLAAEVQQGVDHQSARQRSVGHKCH